MKRPTKKLKKQRLDRSLERDRAKSAHDEVMRVGYEILDEIVCPVVGIKGVWADLTQAELSLYLDSRRREAVRQRKAIITKIARRYGASEYSLAMVWDKPVALVALVAMGRSAYERHEEGKKARPVPNKEAWSLLARMDKRINARRRARQASGD